jgi:hypothetical protein
MAARARVRRSELRAANSSEPIISSRTCPPRPAAVSARGRVVGRAGSDLVEAQAVADAPKVAAAPRGVALPSQQQLNPKTPAPALAARPPDHRLAGLHTPRTRRPGPAARVPGHGGARGAGEPGARAPGGRRQDLVESLDRRHLGNRHARACALRLELPEPLGPRRRAPAVGRRCAPAPCVGVHERAHPGRARCRKSAERGGLAT